ncbi:hypothetical protein DERP_003684 [Dermatophagoides pteronyssinus]|uniref:Uncharacterized protein n=1 Tax=Dermatophagoides pteronyssinus TaxID=6956 RepID=A0ABQ8JLU9_DERPT|nr:hypothetical protein DERP_003684 [Dermatophagoides pteronyssinus]
MNGIFKTFESNVSSTERNTSSSTFSAKLGWPSATSICIDCTAVDGRSSIADLKLEFIFAEKRKLNEINETKVNNKQSKNQINIFNFEINVGLKRSDVNVDKLKKRSNVIGGCNERYLSQKPPNIIRKSRKNINNVNVSVNDAIKNLSANGSNIEPNFDIESKFLAIQPSKKSDNELIAHIVNAKSKFSRTIR